MVEQAELQIDSLKLGPAGTDLTVKITLDEENNKLDPYMLKFYMIDDKGNVLDGLGGSGLGEIENGIEKVELDFLYTPLKEGAKKVRIIPYTMPLAREEVAMLLEEQSLPFVLDQGDFGKVLITDITYLKDKIVVYFDVQSDAIVDNKLSLNSIWLEDTNGNYLMFEDNPSPERIEGNSFKQEFALGKKKGLLVKTNKLSKPTTYEAFEIELP